MIITKDDYIEMGFAAEEKDFAALERCIKRAEYILDSLTNGRASVVAMGEGGASDLVKQAAAFQTEDLFRAESAAAAETGSVSERISIGDFSCSTSSSSGGSAVSVSAPHDKTVVKLLKAAGCLYGGTEVRE